MKRSDGQNGYSLKPPHRRKALRHRRKNVLLAFLAPAQQLHDLARALGENRWSGPDFHRLPGMRRVLLTATPIAINESIKGPQIAG